MQVLPGFESLSLRQTTPRLRLAGQIMWYVYFLKSIKYDFLYVGSTDNIKRRLVEHNSGLSVSTKHYKPFTLEAYIAVKTESKARQLEKYFKTGSGKAILKKRILTDEAMI